MKEMVLDENPRPVPAPAHTISEAWLGLARDPSLFIKYWNYKGAILSGILRAPIFLATYLIGKESLRLAIGAATIQFIFRFFFAGISGAMVQTFRRVEPPWKALFSLLMIVPLVSHLLEFLLQAGFGYLTGTSARTDEAILRSVSVSIISALFTLFAMRRGVMIVGESESKTLMSDISRLPMVVFHFIAFIPNEISAMLRRGAYAAALISLAAFGGFAQILMWALTNKPSWTYNNGQEIALLKYWGIDGMAALLLLVLVSSIVYERIHRHR